MRSKEKITLKWSKKERDWISHWPEWENGNARAVSHCFFNMIRKYEEFMSYNWEGKRTEFKSLRDHLIEGGFDPDTFTISVNAKLNK